MKIYTVNYLDCIYDGYPMLISAHRSKSGAVRVMIRAKTEMNGRGQDSDYDKFFYGIINVDD